MDAFSTFETTLPFNLSDQQQQYQFIVDSIVNFGFTHYIFYHKVLTAKDFYYGISNLELTDNGLPIFFSLDTPSLSLEAMQKQLAYTKPTLLIWNTQTWKTDKDLMYLLDKYPIMFGVTVPILSPENQILGSISYLRDHVITVPEILERIFDFKQMLFATQYTLDKEISSYLHRLQKHKPNLTLNQRQIEILKLLATGLSSHEVAKALKIQLPTVNYHLKSIYQVTQTNNRTTAVYKALKAGLID